MPGSFVNLRDSIFHEHSSLSVFHSIFEHSFIPLIFLGREQFSESILDWGVPFSIVNISRRVPLITALSMSCPALELPLINSIIHYHAASPSHSPVAPVALVNPARLEGNAVPKTFSLYWILLNLAFIPLTVLLPLKFLEISLPKFWKRHWTVVEWGQFFKFSQYICWEGSIFDKINFLKLDWEMDFWLVRLKFVVLTEWVWKIEEFLKRVYLCFLRCNLILQFLHQFDQLIYCFLRWSFFLSLL